MKRVANTYGLNARQFGNRLAVRQLGAAASFRSQSRVLDGVARGAIAFVPSWIYLGMILLAAAAICVTVNVRGRAEASLAELQLHRLWSDVDAIRKSNVQLELEVRQINTEPAIIESAARARLGMVRPTDIVVPIQSRSGTNLATLSFVR